MQIVQISVEKPLTYLRSGQFISTGTWIHENKVLDNFEVIIGVRGTLHIGQDTQKYEVNPGDVLLLMPGHKHFGLKLTGENDDLSFYWFHFNYKDFIKIKTQEDLLHMLSFGELDGNSAFIPAFMHIKDNSKINIFCREILDFSNTDYHNSRIVDYLLTTLVLEISNQTLDFLSNHIVSSTNNSTLTNITEWIKINYNKNFSLKDLADKFNFNKNYLSKLFKQKIGITINDYINVLRMTKAKEMLIQSNLSIKEIAYSVGYDDEKYFMRIFKKSELMTAKEYRNTFCHTYISNV